MCLTGSAVAKPLGKIIVNSGEALQCPAGGESCVVGVTATGRDSHKRQMQLGSATITIAPAATAKLVFTLNGAAKRLLLAHGPLNATLTVSIRYGANPAILTTHAITIGVPKKHPAHKR
jgi:hypothetical protein